MGGVGALVRLLALTKPARATGRATQEQHVLTVRTARYRAGSKGPVAKGGGRRVSQTWRRAQATSSAMEEKRLRQSNKGLGNAPSCRQARFWCRLARFWCRLARSWCRLARSWCRPARSWCRPEGSLFHLEGSLFRPGGFWFRPVGSGCTRSRNVSSVRPAPYSSQQEESRAGTTSNHGHQPRPKQQNNSKVSTRKFQRVGGSARVIYIQQLGQVERLAVVTADRLE